MRRSLALLLALLTCIGLLAGCAKDENPDTPNPDQGTVTPNPDQGNTPVTPEKTYYKYYYTRTGEETTLNPFLSNAASNYNVVDQCAGQLFGYIPKEDRSGGQIAPIYAAEVPTVDESGLIWTIKLREDAKWSTGEPINADTWIYSIKMAIDPNLFHGTGSQVASNYITIKGAKEYYNSVNEKNGATWEGVGIKKVNDYEFTIECTSKYTAEEVMRHFYLRSSACVYEPIFSKCISADGTQSSYGTSMDTIKFAGRFYIETWNKGTEIIFKKNENWPRADLVHIDEVVSRVVGDESSRLELFEKGETDSIDLGTNGMAKYGEDPRVLIYGSKTINTIEVNQNHADPVHAAVLNDPEFRQALFYATDRNAIAKLTNSNAAPYFLSSQGQILDDGTLYRQTSEAQALIDKNAPNGGYDPTKAKTLYDKVMAKNNLTGITLNLLYTEGNENRRQVSEFMDAEWAKIFGAGFDLELSATASSALLATMRESTKQAVSTWDIAWSGWGLAAETYQPWKKFEKYTSTNSTRYTAYKNETVNNLYKECLKDENRLSDKKLLDLTVKMEQAMYDDMTCVPVYENVNYLMYSERVQLPVDNYTSGLGYGWWCSSLK